MDKGQISNNPLKITTEEKAALKTYGGQIVPRYYTFEGYCGDLYNFINCLFFEGMDNELVRIFEDEKDIDPGLVLEIDAALDLIEKLYSAMYKYGKTMECEQTGYRVDRNYTFDIMQRERITPSNISTSGENYNVRAFQKKHSVLIETKIEPGTPCVDFQKIFGEDSYKYKKEQEILVAPFCKVTDIEELELLHGIKRYKITVSAPEEATPLTEEEQEDKERQRKIFKDSKLCLNVTLSLGEMLDLKDERENIDTLDMAKQFFSKQEIEEYSKWKSAVKKYIEYRFREIALEIEVTLEEQSKYNPEDVLGLSGLDMNYEAVGEVLKTTATTGEKEAQTENKNIGEQ